MKDVLGRVKDFADQAHGEQVRKYSGDRYIVHPVRVMEICKEYTDDVTVLAAALLHDVLEDTDTTKDEIYEFLKKVMSQEQARKTTQLVVDLTDIYIKEDYPKLNRKSRKLREMERLSQAHKDAQTVKYADTIDNCIDITENDKDFAKVFLKEAQGLLESMDKGNPDLYTRAKKIVQDCKQKLDKYN